MIDRELEENIKKTKEFMELWDKFQRFFESALAENQVSETREKEFSSIRKLVNSRYEDLMDSLGVKPLRRFMISPSIYNLLSLEKLSTMSDERSKAVNRDWDKSSEFLDLLLGRLTRKKKRIEGFNRFFFVLKKRVSKIRR